MVSESEVVDAMDLNGWYLIQFRHTPNQEDLLIDRLDGGDREKEGVKMTQLSSFTNWVRCSILR